MPAKVSKIAIYHLNGPFGFIGIITVSTKLMLSSCVYVRLKQVKRQ